MQFLVIQYGLFKKKKLIYVLIFLCIRPIIIASEIPIFGNHIPGEAGTASGLPGNRGISVLHSRAGRYSPVGRPLKELYGFPGRPEQIYSKRSILDS